MSEMIVLLVPLLGTTLGAAMVFLMRNEMNARLEKALLGFAAGVMIAASVWSLLIPSIDMAAEQGVIPWVPALVGFLLGIVFLLLIDTLTPHLHLASDKPEGVKSGFSKTTMMLLAVTIHNIPEGMAVGVAFAGAVMGNTGITMAGALALAVGIAIQNFPEGAIISMPLRGEGMSRTKAFVCGVLSGIVEPIGALLTIWLTSSIRSVFSVLCGRSHDLCCGRGADSGIAEWGTHQYWNHWCGGWICADDGTGCGIRLNG